MRLGTQESSSGGGYRDLLQEGLASVIVNPSAGGGLQERWVEENLDFLPADSVHFTERAGHARELAARAIAAGVRLIVSVGGDGTLHEVVNGMAPQFGNAVLGVVPVGTGNDTVRSLGLPADSVEALRRLRSGIAQSVDVMQVTHDGETTYAVNVATGGLGGVVNDSMPTELKDRWGPLAYARAAISALPALPVYDIELTCDDAPPDSYRAVSLVVANGAYAARGVCVAPGAVMDDGNLSVHLIEESGGTELLGLIPAIMRREVPDRDNYRRWTCRRLVVRTSALLPISLDGEAIEAKELSFRCVPGAIHVLGANTDLRPGEGSEETDLGVAS